MSEAKDSLHAKHVAVCSALKAPKGQYNSYGDYNYRSCEDILEALKPLLLEAGLGLHIHDEVEQIGDRYYIKAVVELTDGKDTVGTCAYAREEEKKKGMDGSQITGTASSYARKYALNALFLIDDTKDADTDENRLQRESAPEDVKSRVLDGIGKVASKANVDESTVRRNLEDEHACTVEAAETEVLEAMLETLKGAFMGDVSLTEIRSE